jgi:hypothetical protein
MSSFSAGKPIPATARFYDISDWTKVHYRGVGIRRIVRNKSTAPACSSDAAVARRAKKRLKGTRMKTQFVIATLIISALPAFAGKDEDDRLSAANTTLTEMADAGDKGIPHDLLNKAVCAIVVPGIKKGGFIAGAKYGRGSAILIGNVAVPATAKTFLGTLTKFSPAKSK